MKIIEDEVIGELRYLTVEFDQTEIIADGGVISQGAAQRYLAKERPDLKIKKCGSFKLNSQERTVTMRVAVALQHKIVNSPDPMNGDREIKLLNPGYDELKAKYDKLKAAVADDSQDFNLATKLAETQKMYHELQNERDEIGAKYDAIVVAASKDAQKFSDLLVENEELKTGMDDIRLELSTPETTGMDDKPLYEWAAVIVCENIELKKQVVALAECAEIDLTSDDENEQDSEDAVDLADDNQKPLGQNLAGEYSGPHGI